MAHFSKNFNVLQKSTVTWFYCQLIATTGRIHSEITTKLMSHLAVDLNAIRIYLCLGLKVFIILMPFFMCYCIENVYFNVNFGHLCYRSCMVIFGIFFDNNVCNRKRCTYLKGFFKTSSKSRIIKLLVNSRSNHPTIYL